MDNTQNIDAGATLYNAFRSLQVNGCCLELLWPFYQNLVTIQPHLSCYQEALKHCANQQNTQLDPHNLLNEIKQCLANNLPVVIGILVYSSFESQMTAQTGYVQLPNPLTEPLLGGHALLITGWDDLKQVVLFQNSYSEKWGNKGLGYLPYAYVSDPNLTLDCHALNQVEIDRSFKAVCPFCGK
jgi:C1A family cysteine protease